jgi:hypothetical protein
VPARVDLEQRPPVGLTPEELAAKVNGRFSVSAYELSTWLLRQDLATFEAGPLRPTHRGRELGEFLSSSE